MTWYCNINHYETHIYNKSQISWKTNFFAQLFQKIKHPVTNLRKIFCKFLQKNFRFWCRKFSLMQIGKSLMCTTAATATVTARRYSYVKDFRRLHHHEALSRSRRTLSVGFWSELRVRRGTSLFWFSK